MALQSEGRTARWLFSLRGGQPGRSSESEGRTARWLFSLRGGQPGGSSV